jgi:leucyl aminopeptidase
MTLKLQLAPSSPLETKADLLVIGVFEGKATDNPVLAELHRALGGGLTELLQAEEFKGKREQRVSLQTLGRLPVSKILILGLGAEKDLADDSVRVFGALAGRAAITEKAGGLSVAVPAAFPTERLRALSEGIVLGAYRFTKYFTGERKPKQELTRVAIFAGGSGKDAKKKPSAADQKLVELGAAVGRGVCIARDLQNEPPNELTPKALAQAAAKVAKDHGLKSTILDMKALVRGGMKLFVAVGQGSVNEPHLAHVVYTPAKKAKKRIAIVGKGLTFDSGGLCIKPAAGMGDMKTDMSGAANVVGLIAAVAATKPDVEVHFIIGCAENMPDAGAYRPSDVFGSLDGKTVEIINTDAEGRLVLADCLAYARKQKPDVIIDNATLTGACVVALGTNCSGFYATNDALADSFRSAAKIAGEQFWQLPLLEDLKDQLKSDIADLKHTGDRWGGSITAALFLREFVGDTPFIHCDIAGPSLASRAHGIYPKGGTGHGVLTFLEFLHAYSLREMTRQHHHVS